MRAIEHACCHAADRQHRASLAVGFVHAGLRRGHKVVYVYVCDARDVDATLALLRAADATIDEALQRGRFDVRDAATTYAPTAPFDVERMLEAVRAAHADALGQGYA